MSLIDLNLAFVHQTLNIPEKALEKSLNILHTKYQETHRYYHTEEHLIDLLQLYDKYKYFVEDSVCLVLSILFHDVIYEVDETSKDNELNSAILFEALYKEYIPVDIINKVKSYIIETKNHNVFDSCDEDLKLFIDMDMSILGRDHTTYLEYCKNIRKEYIHIDKITYCQKRSQILTLFLSNTPNIYSSKIFRPIYEESARRNIESEIILLQDAKNLNE